MNPEFLFKRIEWLIIFVYFFFNSLFLPHGLLYTTLLTPVFIYSLLKRNIYRYIIISTIILLCFFLLQFWYGVDLLYYVRSSALLFSVIVFCVYVYHWAKDFREWDNVMRKLVYVSFLLTIIALFFYSSPEYSKYWWWINEITTGIESFKRLKLLTYEASYLSLLFVPIVCYFISESLLKSQWKKNLLPLILLMLMLAISFSLGVLGGIGISLFITASILLYQKWGWKKLLGLYILLLLLGVLSLWLIYYLFPDSVLVARLNNVLTGRDTSFKGRTTDSFILANVLLEMKNPIWGIGPGQIKALGVDLWKSFYHVHFTVNDVTIPNAAAETLAIFGYIGFIVRIVFQIILFISTKVYTNFYKLSLFIFIFIYQFTGSYIVNVAEYVIWIFAFLPSFKEFEFKNYLKQHAHSISIKS